MLNDVDLKRCKDPFFRVIENTFVISGIKNTYKIMHVSDVHLAVYDELSDDTEKEEAISREKSWMKLKEDFTHWMNEPFGEEQKISSAEVLEKIMDLANEEKPDVLIFSGDILDMPSGAGDRMLEKALENYDGKYIYVPGNHDTEFNEKIRPDDVIVYENNDFAVVGVDDSSLTLSDSQIEKLEKIVNTGKQIILVVHAPIATDLNRSQLEGFGQYFSVDPKREDTNENRIKFVSILEEHDNIKYILCGHLHGYHESEFAPGRKEYACSGSNSGFVHMVTVRG